MAAFQPHDIVPSQTLYVTNLDDQIHVRELVKLLYELFCPYGYIIDIVARKTKTLRGQAFIVFSEITSATAALKGLNGRSILAKKIKIVYSKNKSYKAMKPSDYYRIGKISKLQAKPVVSSTTEDKPAEASSKESHTLFVENIPPDINKDGVELLFNQYPGFKGCRFIEGRCVAFIDFALVSQAEAALQGLQGFRMSHNHALHISFAK